MELAENIFAIVGILTILVLIIFKDKISWDRFGLKPKPWFKGWISILLFSAAVFFLVQFFSPLFEIPDWVKDKDPIISLIIGVFLQEFIFRSLIITYLERFGKQIALIGSTIIFAAIHLTLPDPWFLTILSLVGGYVWGWHFLKFRNIYLLTISHLIANLSFNYIFFN